MPTGQHVVVEVMAEELPATEELPAWASEAAASEIRVLQASVCEMKRMIAEQSKLLQEQSAMLQSVFHAGTAAAVAYVNKVRELGGGHMPMAARAAH